MAIYYGFGSLNVKAESRGSWVGLYKALSESEKEYFNNTFPPLLMAAGVNHISQETIPHILARLDMFDARNERHNTYRGDFEVLHVLAEHGEGAAKAYQAAKKQAAALIEASLPAGFVPSAEAALKRYIGYTTNVQTETSQEFLTSLVKLRFNPFPKLTKAMAEKEDKAFRDFAKSVADGTTPHPALVAESATA